MVRRGWEEEWERLIGCHTARRAGVRTRWRDGEMARWRDGLPPLLTKAGAMAGIEQVIMKADIVHKDESVMCRQSGSTVA